VHDSVYDRIVLLLLQGNALWAKECRCHLPAVDGQSTSTHVRAECPSIHRRYGGHLLAEGNVADLEELFTTIAKYRLKLNTEKCVFKVEVGKFLGFLLTERGIDANPEKCVVIIAMRSPISVKEVQQLTGRMAALSRFVLSGDKGHPYF